jgi:hypothetical protein
MSSLHCNESPIYMYVFSEGELRGLSPNFHIQVSVSDLYTVFTGSVHIFSCSRKVRLTLGIYINRSQTHDTNNGFCYDSLVPAGAPETYGNIWTLRQKRNLFEVRYGNSYCPQGSYFKRDTFPACHNEGAPLIFSFCPKQGNVSENSFVGPRKKK